LNYFDRFKNRVYNNDSVNSLIEIRIDGNNITKPFKLVNKIVDGGEKFND